jgi:hypothetical protein
MDPILSHTNPVYVLMSYFFQTLKTSLNIHHSLILAESILVIHKLAAAGLLSSALQGTQKTLSVTQLSGEMVPILQTHTTNLCHIIAWILCTILQNTQ